MRLSLLLLSALALSGCMMVVPIPGSSVPGGAPESEAGAEAGRALPGAAPGAASLSFAAATPASHGGFEAALNAVRVSSGLGGLRSHPRLAAAARAHARDMIAQGYISHRGRDGSNVQDRARGAGCNGGYMAENIAWGQPDEQAVFTGWMRSSAHHHNMMGRPYGVYGLGEVGGTWVLMFADRC